MSNTAVNQEMTRMLATTRSHEETRKNSTQTLGTMSKQISIVLSYLVCDTSLQQP